MFKVLIYSLNRDETFWYVGWSSWYTLKLFPRVGRALHFRNQWRMQSKMTPSPPPSRSESTRDATGGCWQWRTIRWCFHCNDWCRWCKIRRWKWECIAIVPLCIATINDNDAEAERTKCPLIGIMKILLSQRDDDGTRLRLQCWHKRVTGCFENCRRGFAVISKEGVQRW